MSETIWPQNVLDASNSIISDIKDLLEEEEVFDQGIFRKHLCSKFLDKFLAGANLVLTEAEFTDVYELSYVESLLTDMEHRGLLMSIEDEDGELLYMLKPAEEADIVN